MEHSQQCSASMCRSWRAPVILERMSLQQMSLTRVEKPESRKVQPQEWPQSVGEKSTVPNRRASV